MVKKKDELPKADIDTREGMDLNEIDALAEDLGIPVIDDSLDTPKGERTPTTGVDVKKVAKSMIPDSQAASMLGSKIGAEFTNISSAYDKSISVLSDLERYKKDVLKDISPTVQRLKQVARLYSPKVKQMLPKVLSDKFDKLVAAAPGSTGSGPLTEDQSRDATINAHLAEVFGTQQQITNERYIKEQTDKLVTDKMVESRHTESITVLSQIRNLTKTNQLFFDNVFKKYLMKSLELKYRHIFISQDIMKYARVGNELMESKLNAIKHNTSLPDTVKKRHSEEYRAYLRVRTFGKVTDKLGDIGSKFGKRALDGLKEKVSGGIMEALKTIGGGVADAGEAVHEQGQMNEEMGVKSDSMGTKLISSIVKRTLVDTGLVSVKAGIGQQKFQDADTLVKHVTNMLPYKINDYISTKEGGIGALLRTLLPPIEEERGTIDNIYDTKGTDEIPFDVITRKSIVDIIPGFLSKILQQTTNTVEALKFQITSLLSKDDDTKRDELSKVLDNEELVFDRKSEDFLKVSEFRERTLADMFLKKEERTAGMKPIIDRMYASYTRREGTDGSTFKEALPDIISFVTNISKHGKVVNPKNILKYLNGGDLNDGEQAYMESILKDVPEENRKELANILANTFFKDIGTEKPEVDTTSVQELDLMLRDLGIVKDEYVDKIQELNAYGGKRYFSDLVGTQTDKSMELKAEKLHRQYLSKYGKRRFERDDDLQREFRRELKELGKDQGVSHEFVRKMQSDVDSGEILGGIDADSKSIRERLESEDATRSAANSEDFNKRWVTAFKEQLAISLQPITDLFAKSNVDMSDMKFGQFGRSKSKEEIDDVTEETGIPNRDAAQVSGPGLYYQGVNRELHVPIDTTDEEMLRKALSAESSGTANDYQKAELIKNALSAFLDSKGITDPRFRNQFIGNIKIPGSEVKVSSYVNLESAPTANQRTINYTDVDARRTRPTGSITDKEGLLGLEDAKIADIDRAWDPDKTQSISKKTGIRNNDDVKVTGPGAYFQGIKDELHMPIPDGIDMAKFTEEAVELMNKIKNFSIPGMSDTKRTTSVDEPTEVSKQMSTLDTVLTSIDDNLKEHKEGSTAWFQAKLTIDSQIIDLLNGIQHFNSATAMGVNEGEVGTPPKPTWSKKKIAAYGVGGLVAGAVIVPPALSVAAISGMGYGAYRLAKKTYQTAMKNNRAARAAKGAWDLTSGAVKTTATGYGKVLGMYAEAGSKALGLGANISGAIAKSLTGNAFKKYVDVYRKDEVNLGTPLVKGDDVKAGKYMLADGDILKDCFSIKEPIYDAESQNVAISTEDIKHGLVDYKNQPLKGGLAGIMTGGILGLAGTGLKAYGTMAKASLEATASVVSMVLGKVPGISSFFKGGSDKAGAALNAKTTKELITQHLIQIVELLQPISDKVTGKIREGSYKDYLADKEEARKKKADKALNRASGIVKSKKAAGGGILAGLAGMAGFGGGTPDGGGSDIVNAGMGAAAWEGTKRYGGKILDFGKKHLKSGWDVTKKMFKSPSITSKLNKVRTAGTSLLKSGTAAGTAKGVLSKIAAPLVALQGAWDLSGDLRDPSRLAKREADFAKKGIVGKALTALNPYEAGSLAGTQLNKGMGAISGMLTGGKYKGAGFMGDALYDILHPDKGGTKTVKSSFFGKSKLYDIVKLRNVGYRVPEDKIKVLHKFEQEVYNGAINKKQLTNGEMLPYMKKFGLDPANKQHHKYFMMWYKTIFLPVFKVGIERLKAVFQIDYSDQADLRPEQFDEYADIIKQSKEVQNANKLGIIMSVEGFDKWTSKSGEKEGDKKDKPTAGPISPLAAGVTTALTGKRVTDQSGKSIKQYQDNVKQTESDKDVQIKKRLDQVSKNLEGARKPSTVIKRDGEMITPSNIDNITKDTTISPKVKQDTTKQFAKDIGKSIVVKTAHDPNSKKQTTLMEKQLSALDKIVSSLNGINSNTKSSVEMTEAQLTALEDTQLEEVDTGLYDRLDTLVATLQSPGKPAPVNRNEPRKLRENKSSIGINLKRQRVGVS